MKLKTRNNPDLRVPANRGTRALRASVGGSWSTVRRSGFSLNEVLVAIFVMAIGLVGVFSLFPIGLLKVSQAVDFSQSADLGRSAVADMRVQGLLDPDRYRKGFRTPLVSNNPFVQDWGLYNPDTLTGSPEPLRRYAGEPGLPVCIDPDGVHHEMEDREDMELPRFPVGRLGQLDVGNPSQPTWGMQRVTPTDAINNNFNEDSLTDSWINGNGVRLWPDREEGYLNAGLVHELFGYRNGLIFREDRKDLPVVDHHGQAFYNHRYTWMATAQLIDAGDEHTYHVSVVTFSNRDLAGEQSVAAIYLPDPNDPSGGPSNQVVLSWPYGSALTLEIPRNAWLLDATYTNPSTQINGPTRAHWYRILERGEPRRAISGGMYVMRRLITLDRPVRAITPLMNWGPEGNVLDGIDGDGDGLVDELDEAQPVQVNVAVIIPGVISVYEKTVTAR